VLSVDTVPVVLTPEGQKRRDDIIALVFNYLDLIRTGRMRGGYMSYERRRIHVNCALVFNYLDLIRTGRRAYSAKILPITTHNIAYSVWGLGFRPKP
jgi:hypothetical protein